MRISIGVFAYNEGGSIEQVLTALLAQNTRELGIREIIVVSFGSTDDTNAIVKRVSQYDPRIRLVSDPVCQGKSASVSRYLALADGDFWVLMSADTELRANDTIYQLVIPLVADPQIFIAGARHRTINHRSGFLSFAGQTLWSLLDDVSMQNPKISGDLMVLRAGVIHAIPTGIVNDDAYLELWCQQRGLKKHYCRDAEVFIRIPESLRDYVLQRRRVYAGHRQLRSYLPQQRLATMQISLLLRLLARRVDSCQTLGYALLLMLLDAAIRLHSRLEKIPVVYQGGRWPPVKTTKFAVPTAPARFLSSEPR